MNDHKIREIVNELRDIACEYGHTQQLRDRIAYVIVDTLKEIAPLKRRILELERVYEERGKQIARLEISVQALPDIVQWESAYDNHEPTVLEVENSLPTPVAKELTEYRAMLAQLKGNK